MAPIVFASKFRIVLLEKTRIFEKVTPTIKVILLLDLFTNYKIISLTKYIFNINKKLFYTKNYNQSINIIKHLFQKD